MAAPEELSWRKSIVSQLQERNRLQTRCFEEIIAQNNKLFDNANTLRSENLQLSILNEKLKVGSEQPGTALSSVAGSKFAERIQHLEQKLLAQQEELTELHRRKGENVQKIIDLNVKLQEKEKVLAAKETSLDAAMVTNSSLRTEIQVYENSLKELQDQNQMLKDEHQALQLLFASLEDKLRTVQDENRELVERLISFKAKDADKMNEENDNFIKKRNAKMQKELEEACRDTRGLSPDEARDTGGPMFHCSTLPTSATVKFDAHDGEVNAVKWSPVDKLLATGGADRKVKLWDVSKGTAESRGVLQGSNKGVMSVDFDMSGALILGASNDMASRVWSVADQRLKHTLTGHSEKVMAAKFLGERSKVVSGSYDRTLKIWDIRGGACIETKFAGSKCNDLVTADCAGSTIISCHFDKKIRFWDIRMDSRANDIELKGRVTSLDLTKDGKYLLSCDRDDTLKLLDLRKNEIVQTFTCDDFKVGCDWARATFSPDGQYVAAGSADGSVFVWGVMTTKVEAVLKEHTSATTATAWSPYTSYLASVDRSKKAIIWGH